MPNRILLYTHNPSSWTLSLPKYMNIFRYQDYSFISDPAKRQFLMSSPHGKYYLYVVIHACEIDFLFLTLYVVVTISPPFYISQKYSIYVDSKKRSC